MLLAIDVGNTNTVCGAFRGERLIASWRVSSDGERTADEWAALLFGLLAYRGLRPEDIRGVVAASVVPPVTATLESFVREYLHLEMFSVGPGIKSGVHILLENPKEVGADRVANALAGYHVHGGPVIIVDFGTATTFDAVSGRGEYLGGAIAPGIAISMEALFRYTAKLPRVELTRPLHAIGRNTVEGMQSGIMFGYVGLVEGLVRRFREQLGQHTKVVATGGLADAIARETRAIDVVDPNLTLTGLRMIYELNVGQPAHPAGRPEKRER